jgi:hypothetical protein
MRFGWRSVHFNAVQVNSVGRQNTIESTTESTVLFGKYFGSLLNRDLVKVYLTVPRNTTAGSMEHVQAAVQWLFRAQDAFSTGGVARSYSIVYNPFFKRRGWIACYPETTGYIIPTIFDYARLMASDEAFARAVRMADWECEVQMPNGAVQGGTTEQFPAPAIFNTGQVIFGWVRAFAETKKEKYLAAALKAGNFLVSQQDADGAWRRNLSLYATKQLETYSYNTRTAWALMCLFKATNGRSYREAAIKNVEFALREQLPNGWFKNNCLSDATQPLLHTIAYCLQGILEVGGIEANERYIGAAQRAADALMKRQENEGGLRGRFDANWNPTVTYSCLTGDAQIAVIWGRLYEITEDDRYLDSLVKMNTYLKRHQVWHPGSPDIHGGICGSFPIHGIYGKYEILSWAVKFFIDALLLERVIFGCQSA